MLIETVVTKDGGSSHINIEIDTIHSIASYGDGTASIHARPVGSRDVTKLNISPQEANRIIKVLQNRDLLNNERLDLE